MIYGDERINMHITIMSVIGIFMAAYGLSLREAEAIIIALFAYFVYVDYQSCIRLKEIKEWKSNKDVE